LKFISSNLLRIEFGNNSKRLAQAVLKHIIVQTKPNRAELDTAISGDRETNMPAILVEGGFVTNEAELQNCAIPFTSKKWHGRC